MGPNMRRFSSLSTAYIILGDAFAIATKSDITAGSSTNDIQVIPVPSSPIIASYTGIPFIVTFLSTIFLF